MKKKTIIILLLIGVATFILKGYIIHSYTLSDTNKKAMEKIAEGLIIDDLKVIYHEDLEDEEYIEYKNLKGKNIFKEFNCLEEDNSFQCTKDEKTIFTMKKTTSFVDKLSKSKYKDGTKIIKKNKITTDIDLFGFIKDASTSKNTIVKPISNIKRDYILQMYAIDYVPVIHSMDLVEGEYSGYILHISSKTRELYLTKNHDTYLFSFTNLDEFNEEIIEEFMNSIIIS